MRGVRREFYFLSECVVHHSGVDGAVEPHRIISFGLKPTSGGQFGHGKIAPDWNSRDYIQHKKYVNYPAQR